MSEPDERPRPQYGEYATPEEQRASIKDLSAHPLGAELHQPAPASASGYPHAGARDAGHPPAGSQPFSSQRPSTQHPGVRQRATTHAVDRIATLALIAIGLYSVLTTLATMTDLGGYLDQTMQQVGIGSYDATPATGVVAAVISGVNIVVWLASTVLSVLSMRAGRVSFWIPLTAGVVVTVVTSVCYGVLLMNDPSFVDYITRTP